MLVLMSYGYRFSTPVRWSLMALTLSVLPLVFALLGYVAVAAFAGHFHTYVAITFRQRLAIAGALAGLLSDAAILLEDWRH